MIFLCKISCLGFMVYENFKKIKVIVICGGVFFFLVDANALLCSTIGK